MKNKKRNSLKLVVIISLIATSFCIQAKPTIQQLTSSQNAESVSKKVPSRRIEPSASSNPVMGDDSVHKHSLIIGLGQTFFLGDLAEKVDDGITIPDFYYSYSASHSFDMLVNFHTSSHHFKGNKVNLMGSALSIKARIFQLDSFAPFALAGLGFYWPQVNDSERKATFGFNFGGGVDLTLNNHFKVGLIFHYHDPFDVKQENHPKVEGRYYKLLITAGYTF